MKSVLDVQTTKWENIAKSHRRDGRGLHKCNTNGDKEVSIDRSTITDQNQQRHVGNERWKGGRALGPLTDFLCAMCEAYKSTINITSYIY